MNALSKVGRMAWRVSRNAASALPPVRRLLFPSAALASRFGRDDAAYAWQVFAHHQQQLMASGFAGAAAILEVGPGQNCGTALLWWTRAACRGDARARVVLWDVFANCDPSVDGFWSRVAIALTRASQDHLAATDDAQLGLLQRVATGELTPRIEYVVGDLNVLMAREPRGGFDLIYSHAALEHVWRIDECLSGMRTLGAAEGWYSYRIDLADHGRRDSNYVEMLEWSVAGYWLTMRFIPGAINRWRAHQYEAALERLGIQVLSAKRELRERLPIARARLAQPFRALDDAELRTTAIDIVGRRVSER